MEIRTIEFEGKLVIIKDNLHIHITPFLTPEHGNIKLGIDAPRGLVIDREEVYLKKQSKLKAERSAVQTS